MKLFAMPQRFRKSQDSFLHSPGGLDLTMGPQIVPGQPHMIRVMKLGIGVHAALHPIR